MGYKEMKPEKKMPKVETPKIKRPSVGRGSAGSPSRTKYTCFMPVYKPSPMPPIKNPKPEEQTKPKNK